MPPRFPNRIQQGLHANLKVSEPIVEQKHDDLPEDVEEQSQPKSATTTFHHAVNIVKNRKAMLNKD